MKSTKPDPQHELAEAWANYYFDLRVAAVLDKHGIKHGPPPPPPAPTVAPKHTRRPARKA